MKTENLKLEDSEDASYIEKPKDRKKKNLKKEANDRNATPVKSIFDEENVEFILMDFKNFDELNRFKYIKSLTLIQQGIKSVDVKFICLF